MTTEFILPELGENIDSGDIVEIFVSEGDTIEVDQHVLDIETDKAVIEVPSNVNGVVKEILVSAGDSVSPGQKVFSIESDDSAPETESEPESQSAAEEKSEPEPEPEPKAEAEEKEKSEEETKDETEEESEPAAEEKAGPEAEPEPEPASAAEVEEVVDFKLPDLGENIESGDVVTVLVAEGDTVEADQAVLEVETDKAVLEVPSSVTGTVKEVLTQAGESVSPGQVIMRVLSTQKAAKPAPAKEEKQPAEAQKTADPEKKEKESKPKPAAAEEKTGADKKATPPAVPETAELVPQPAKPPALVPASPSVRRIAREIGVDITRVPGSGPAGRVSMADVKNYARETNLKRTETSEKQPAGQPAKAEGVAVSEKSLPDFSKWGQVEREKMSNVRRATAEHLSRAWHAPHVTQFDKADITELEQLRKKYGPKVEEAGGKLTITVILLKLVAKALQDFPQVNASVDMANREIVYKKYYHIGVAVDTPRGLLVPVLRDVDQKNIIQLAVELTELSERARNRKTSLDELQGSTFSISNLGGIGGTAFTPVVNWPEVAILGVSRGGFEPVYNKQSGEFTPRLMLPLSLSYDHRLVDGADGARYLRRVVELLENPFLLSLEG